VTKWTTLSAAYGECHSLRCSSAASENRPQALERVGSCVFAGIALRVRAFLFLGTSFLVLAIVTIIWYAAVDLDQTWIWYASGIVVGVAIVVLFAVFEKKRHDVMGLVVHLKQWDA
jgi:hypothetical protein